MNKELTPLEALDRLYNYPKLKYRNEIAYLLEKDNLPIFRKTIEKALKALEIIASISKQTTHFRLVQRNMGNDKFNYYLAIDNCEYRLKDKEEYDLLKEVLL